MATYKNPINLAALRGKDKKSQFQKRNRIKKAPQLNDFYLDIQSKTNTISSENRSIYTDDELIDQTTSWSQTISSTV